MTREEAIRRIKDHIKVHHIGEYPHIRIAEALNMAIAAIRAQQEAEKNEPLTLDELREMEGEPYWHVSLQSDLLQHHWAILPSEVAKCPQDYFYSERWLAYRHKPKEDAL